MVSFRKSTSSVTLINAIFLIIILIITFYLGMRYQQYKAIPSYQPSPSITSPSITSPDSSICNSDADCTGYGTCNVNCVNKYWADTHPDNGPFCSLLLPEFECKCIDSKCKPNILNKAFQ